MTTDEVRRANVIVLAVSMGSQLALSKALGKSANQINQWAGKGSERNMSHKTARWIESKLQLDRGWMDQPHG